MFLIPWNHLELFIYSFMVLNIFKIQYYCQICEIFTFWFIFAVNYNYQHMGVDLVYLMQFCLLNIHVRSPMMISRWVWSYHPWAILINREIQNGRQYAFIKIDIYLKVMELETSYWCQTICFWFQGIIWNCVYGVTLLEKPIWLQTMWNIYFVFPSAVKYVSKINDK